jgi:glucose/arabinose dehydrogenase
MSAVSGYSQADLDNGEKAVNKKQFYGCGIVFEGIRCEPLRNIVLNEFDGTARVIYDPSRFSSSGTGSSGSISVEPRAKSLPDLRNNEWQFIAVTWDEAMLKLYRNGMLEDVSARAGSLVDPVPAQIGAGEGRSSKSNYWKGDMDEIRIYDRALTENEIIEILTKSNDVLDGLVGYWTFDGNTNDLSGNNNHGVYQGDKPEFVDGTSGKALRFDGKSFVGLPSQLAFSKALSFTGWIKPNTGALDGSREIFNNNQFILRLDPQSEVPNRLAAFVQLAMKTNVYGYTYKGLIVSMAFAPDGRLFFTEKNSGNVRIIQDDKVLETPFVSLSNIYAHGESGLLGLTLDPDFDENHFVYLYYTYGDDETRQVFNRVVRFTDHDNTGIDMKVLLDSIPANDQGIHSSGALAFGPDEKLYITVGDAWQPESSQDPSILTGKILRINRDGTIPDDNPWLWDNNPSRVYSNVVLDENFMCAKGNVTESGLKVCNFSIQSSKDNTFVVEKDFNVKQTNLTSIRITINNPSGEVSLYRDYSRDITGFMLGSERDWSRYTYLTFWMNGSEDNSILGVKIRDSQWDDRDDEYIIHNNFTGWKSFTIPLMDTYPTMNFSSVRGIEFVFHKGWNTTINIDAVYFANSDDSSAERGNYSHVSPVYTIGHRNMFGIAFNNEGVGIVTENGMVHYDEINKIEKGGNYGWPTLQPPNVAPELSTHSVKPLTSYRSVIAPAQAMFYDDDKIPELKGKFIFASYLTSTLRALHFANSDEIVYEEIINANHTGPAISLAQSPDGYIYYGGSAIYKLEKVDLVDKLKFPISVEITGEVEVKDLQLDKAEKKVIISMTTQSAPQFVSVKIPRLLLDGILSVNHEEEQIDFRIDDSGKDYNIVSVHLRTKGDSVLTIIGTTVIPEFNISVIVVMIFFISCIIGITMTRRKRLTF